ncbi:MAG: hypothetical protein V1859_01440 [archaeon]
MVDNTTFMKLALAFGLSNLIILILLCLISFISIIAGIYFFVQYNELKKQGADPYKCTKKLFLSIIYGIVVPFVLLNLVYMMWN